MGYGVYFVFFSAPLVSAHIFWWPLGTRPEFLSCRRMNALMSNAFSALTGLQATQSRFGNIFKKTSKWIRIIYRRLKKSNNRVSFKYLTAASAQSLNSLFDSIEFFTFWAQDTRLWILVYGTKPGTEIRFLIVQRCHNNNRINFRHYTL